jgi:hypothetical protein
VLKIVLFAEITLWSYVSKLKRILMEEQMLLAIRVSHIASFILFHSHFKLVMLPGVFVAMLFISVVFVDG